MTVAGPNEDTVRAALRLAVRAPSVHNCQPWRWLVGPGTVRLYLDGSRQMPATDPHGRDLLISCGAALHHLLVGLASLGYGARVRRMPDPTRPGHLATVEPFRQPDLDDALAAAIPRRCTDRRRFSSWPVPAELIGELQELADVQGVGLEVITEPALRWRLFRAVTAAAQRQATDPAYAAELALWSGRGDDADAGVPAANAPPAQHVPGQMPLREFARPGLAQPPSTGEPENAALLLLTTATDTARDWLRVGEATSAILLTVTREGLASSPLTQPLEIDDTRQFIRARVAKAHSAHPQILLRIGWTPVGAPALPSTPRRPLDEVVAPLGR